MEECKKTKFADQAAAMFYIAKLKATSCRDKIPQRAYLCEICLSWHITSIKLTPDQRRIQSLERKIKSLEEQLVGKDRIIKYYKTLANGKR